MTIDEAVPILAAPRKRGRAAAAPLRELGEDLVSGKPVVIKDGRWGAYVTDGEYNASLKAADSIETITIERAGDLLAERRARGPAKRSRSRKK